MLRRTGNEQPNGKIDSHLKVQMGGITAALEAYSTAAIPNVIVIESGSRSNDLLAGLDSLADVCDAGTRVVVIGRRNDVTLYRELVRRGVSEYVIAPVGAIDVVRSICTLFTAPDAKPVGHIVAVIGAKGGVGASTIAYNVAWAVARDLKLDTVVADLDLGFGTAGLRAGYARAAHESGCAGARENPAPRAATARAHREVTLRRTPKQYVQNVVDYFQLAKWVGQDEARALLVQAGYRGQAPYITFLFFRMVVPAIMLVASLFYIFVVAHIDQPPTIKIGMCIAATYFGMHLPMLFVKNQIARRQLSIKRAFPDALDLLLICIEPGMSVEAGLKRWRAKSERNRSRSPESSL